MPPPLAPELPCPSGHESLSQFTLLPSIRSSVAQPAGGRKQCSVSGCLDLVAPTMWHHHMDSHLKGILPGAVPDAWLLEHGLSVCHSCIKLVSTSHLVSHQQKCVPAISISVPPPSDTSADLPSLPSLEEVCSLRCPTIRFVPNKAKPAVARVFSTALMAVIFENSVSAWLRLFMLPKCVLPSAKRVGRHNKPVPIESLCAMWADGKISDLGHKAVSRSSCPKQPSVPKGDTVKKRVSSVISLSQDGLFGKACQVLVSPGVAPNNAETWSLLVSKHLECACPSVPTLPSVDINIPPDLNLMAILMSFPKLTAAGPSGLRIQHIIDASEVPHPPATKGCHQPSCCWQSTT